MPPSATTVRFAGAADIVGAVPYLLGYHPDDEIVALYLGNDHRITTVASVAVAQPSSAQLAHLALHVPADGADGVVLLGYGDQSVRAALDAASRVFDVLLGVHGLFFITGQRCVCLLPGCTCPATGGIDVDPKNTPSAAQLSVEGFIALPSRADLHTLVAGDPAGQAEVETALATLPPGFQPVTEHVTSALATASSRRRLTADQAAALAAALADPGLLNVAWRQVCGCMWQRDLWLDLTRRVPDGYLAAPASVAAWCAWRRGEQALAEAALHRAHQAEAASALTDLLERILSARLPARLFGRPPAG